MFSFLGSVIKWSLLTLTIIVLSHIIEIQGVTISQHVLNGMHMVSGYTPKNPVKTIKEDYVKTMNKRMEDLNKIDQEVTPEDQKALNQVIQKDQQQHKK